MILIYWRMQAKIFEKLNYQARLIWDSDIRSIQQPDSVKPRFNADMAESSLYSIR